MEDKRDILNLVCVFNPTKFLVNVDKAIKLAKWGRKCRNPKTKKRIIKSCYKIIKNSKVNTDTLKVMIKS